MAINTRIDNVNAALTRVGEDRITSFDDGILAAQIATENYDTIVEDELSAYPWLWARKTLTLNLISGTPQEPWTYAYQLPNDVLFLRTIKADGQTFPYERQSEMVLCDISGDYEVVAHYTWRPDEDDFPGWFREIIIRRLEAVFLRGLGERHDEAEARDKAAERKLLRSKTTDAQGQSTRNPQTSPTLTARLGGLVSADPRDRFAGR